MSYNLDDVKRAADSSGADLIAFSDLRSRAADARRQIDTVRAPLADAMRRVDGQERKLTKRRLLRTLGIATKQRDVEKEFLKEYADAGASLLVKEQEEKIKKLEEQIANTSREIETGDKELDGFIKSTEELGKQREIERNAYSEAKKKYEELKSNPDRALGSTPTDDQKKQLGESIDKIIGKCLSI